MGKIITDYIKKDDGYEILTVDTSTTPRTETRVFVKELPEGYEPGIKVING